MGGSEAVFACAAKDGKTLVFILLMCDGHTPDHRSSDGKERDPDHLIAIVDTMSIV